MRTVGSLRLLSALTVEVLNFFLLIDAILEALKLGELRDSTLVDILDTFESFVANRLLVVCQNQASEFTSPKEVFSLVLGLGQGKNRFSWIFIFRYLVRTEFELKMLVTNLKMVGDRRSQSSCFLSYSVFKCRCFNFDRTKFF